MFHMFILCSGIAACVNIGIGYLFYGIAGMNTSVLFVLSVGLAFLSGMGVSFFLNRRFTYRPSGRSARAEFPDFVLVSLGGLTLTTVLSALFLAHGGAAFRVVFQNAIPAETGAHMAAVGLTAIYSFVAHKTISFRRTEDLSLNPVCDTYETR